MSGNGAGTEQHAIRRVSLVLDGELGPAAHHGMEELERAFRQRGVEVQTSEPQKPPPAGAVDATIIAGVTVTCSLIPRLLSNLAVPLPEAPEALVIHPVVWQERTAWVLCGADDRGLMYAFLDVAERIGWPSSVGAPLASLRPTSERPAVAPRVLAKMVTNPSEFESYYFSEAHWTKYFDMMARCRFDTFLLMYGYDAAGYYEPPYPFLFALDKFPDVHVPGLSGSDQARNLDMLNRVIAMAHDRGIDVTIAIWMHIYRPREETTVPIPGTVWGLDSRNLLPYTEAALAKFLALVPGIDAMQFRVHIESALTLPEQIPFWDRVYRVIKAARSEMPIDMRVKGFTDDMIDAALESGLRIRLATKFWGEQLGLPYHPTHLIGRNQFKRRHSYADLLPYPRRYRMHWRVWNVGTTRVLIWGDPEYTRRFVASTHLGDGQGFEVFQPLTSKMHGQRDAETFDLLAPEYRYYDWEFERYWHFYQVWGRVGYCPDVSPEIWHAEFEKRFGPDAGPYLERALHRASQVLPRINAYNLFDLTANRFWAEEQRWLDLPDYAAAQPSDTAQFVGLEEAAWYHIHGIESPKRWPEETSAWFIKAAEDVSRLMSQADERIGTNGGAEYASTMVDLGVLAGLARYHGQRIHAGFAYACYKQSGDLNALGDAIRFERQAIDVWEEIVDLTEGVYHDKLAMVRRVEPAGHWKDELALLEAGLVALEQERDAYSPPVGEVVAAFDFGGGQAEAGYQPVSRVHLYDHIRGGYGWQHTFFSPSPTFPPLDGPKQAIADFIHGPEPRSYTYSAFSADIASGHYRLKFTMLDSSASPKDYGPMWIAANGMDATERFTVPAGQRVEVELETTVTDNRLNVVFNSATSGQWLVNSLAVQRIGPQVAHVPVRKAVPGQGILMRATAFGDDAIASVHVVCGNEDQGYRRVPMDPAGDETYQTLVPPIWVLRDLCYYIEAVDRAGRRATFPPHGGMEPIQVTVTRDDEPPTVSHVPIETCSPREPLPVSAQVHDPSGVKWVRLRYRGVSQHQDFRTLAMLATGVEDEHRAVIPAEHIRPEWDLMYYVEVMDNCGNGAIYPNLDVETPYVVVKVEQS